jgi:hypothetical protein
MKLPVILALALAATTANAQPAVPHPGACRADAQKLCPDAVASMDRSKVQACLAGKLTEVSSDCKDNLVAMKKAEAASQASGTKQ